MRLILFDIDMTLIDPAGAGRAGMERAFTELFGIDNAFEGVSFLGRTDRRILRQALELRGLIDGDDIVRAAGGQLPFGELVPLFAATYVRFLEEVLPARPSRVLPGVRELLELLAAAPETRMGLATGNFRRGAMTKLRYHDLGEHLGEGGFGDEHFDRRSVVSEAIARLDRASAPAPADVVVVGDTPDDVAAGKAVGGAAVAVATGFHSREALAAAGADMVFPDFSDSALAARALCQAADTATRHATSDPAAP